MEKRPVSDTEAELPAPLEESSGEAHCPDCEPGPVHLTLISPTPAQPPQLSCLHSLPHPPGPGSRSVMVLRALRLGRAAALCTDVCAHLHSHRLPHSSRPSPRGGRLLGAASWALHSALAPPPLGSEHWPWHLGGGGCTDFPREHMQTV